jgi:hypothetical protein
MRHLATPPRLHRRDGASKATASIRAMSPACRPSIALLDQSGGGCVRIASAPSPASMIWSWGGAAALGGRVRPSSKSAACRSAGPARSATCRTCVRNPVFGTLAPIRNPDNPRSMETPFPQSLRDAARLDGHALAYHWGNHPSSRLSIGQKRRLNVDRVCRRAALLKSPAAHSATAI